MFNLIVVSHHFSLTDVFYLQIVSKYPSLSVDLKDKQKFLHSFRVTDGPRRTLVIIFQPRSRFLQKKSERFSHRRRFDETSGEQPCCSKVMEGPSFKV